MCFLNSIIRCRKLNDGLCRATRERVKETEDTGNAVSISQPPLSVFTSYSEFFILKQFRYPL